MIYIRASQKVSRPGREMVAAEAENRSMDESGETSMDDIARSCPARRLQENAGSLSGKTALEKTRNSWRAAQLWVLRY